MLVLEVERGLQGVWAGHRQLAAHRIWEASAHSTVVLDGAADLPAICLLFLAKGRGALTSTWLQRDVSGLAWHVVACVAVFVPVLPVQAKEDAHGGQHMKMCLTWCWGTSGTSGNMGTKGGRVAWVEEGSPGLTGGDGGHG